MTDVETRGDTEGIEGEEDYDATRGFDFTENTTEGYGSKMKNACITTRWKRLQSCSEMSFNCQLVIGLFNWYEQ